MKKALSIILVMAIFLASFPMMGIVAEAACTHGTTDLLEFGDYLIEAGSNSKWYDTVLADQGERGTESDPIIIDSAEEFVCLAKGVLTDTAGKYYKVADGISAFDLSRGNLNLDRDLDYNISIIKGSGKNHAGGTPGFQGTFDGNGVTVYGAWTNHTEGNVSYYAGLFNVVQGNVTIKNINVKFSSFTAKYGAGSIVGRHIGDGTQTLTIENCTVTDTHIEVLESGWARGVGAIVGVSENLKTFIDTDDTDNDGDTTETIYLNGTAIIKNCFVNLDEKYFISQLEQGAQIDPNIRGAHGGLVGFFNHNGLKASDCIVIGVTPYATTSCTAYNDIQHSALETHFENIYTNMPSGKVVVGGNGHIYERDFTGRIFSLETSQIKGYAAMENMDLDWDVWMVDNNDYPELKVTHSNTIYTKNGDGTHSETCICGFGGPKSSCTYENGKCTVCEVNTTCSKKKTIYWDGTISYGFIDQSKGTKDDPVIINSASELAYLVTCKENVSTLSDGSQKYFKIADGIGTIILQDQLFEESILAINSATEVKKFVEKYSSWLYTWPYKGWEQASFCGYFDGNGAKIYGLYQVSPNNAGLFSSIDGGASIHNLAVMNSYLISTASNYQVGAIAAVGNGADYGVKTNGVVWFDSCMVANCYMRNSASDTYAKQRNGIILGNAYEEAVIIDNCLVYGNDAYYGDSFQYAIPLLGTARNNVLTTGRKPAELVAKIQEDVNETDQDMYYNSVRNTVALGCDIVNTYIHYSYRLNEPDCFENCYTDGITGTVELTNGSWTYNDQQIKYATAQDLAGVTIGDAWFATNGLPELKAFHFVAAIANDDDTHTISCDCGISGISEPHNVSEPQYENVIEGTCTTDGSYDLVYYCDVCHKELSRETVKFKAEGHIYADDFSANCSVCGEIRELITHGDVNGDGSINGRDYALMMQHLNGWDVVISYEACDTTRDGLINGRDYALLMQYLNNWDVCIHRYIAATCYSPKSCLNCAETVGAKLDHNYVMGECIRVNQGKLCNHYKEDYCPKLYFTGDMSQIIDETQTSKKIECSIDVQYRSSNQIVDRTAKIKIQGTSSTQWRKKNYTITFYEDNTYEDKLGIDVGWGAQTKYCLKANWIDKTHSRNVVSAKLAGEMQQKYGLFETAPNNGAVDGFPVEIYINGEFHGLYTMNIPKDEWQFNMDKKNPNHIVICGENWNDPVLFKDEPNLTDWSVEMGPENDETLAKIKRLSDFIRFSSDEEFKANIDQYLNLDSTLNYYVFMDCAYLVDNRGKNMLLATYDGNVWYPSLYDLDTSWGTNWKGDGKYSYESGLLGSIRQSLLWARIEDNFSQELAERYFELRNSVLEPEYIMSKFNEFYASIPTEVLERETEKWTRPNDPIPGYDFAQIQHYLDSVFPRLDAKYSDWLQ